MAIAYVQQAVVIGDPDELIKLFPFWHGNARMAESISRIWLESAMNYALPKITPIWCLYGGAHAILIDAEVSIYLATTCTKMFLARACKKSLKKTMLTFPNKQVMFRSTSQRSSRKFGTSFNSCNLTS